MAQLAFQKGIEALRTCGGLTEADRRFLYSQRRSGSDEEGRIVLDFAAPAASATTDERHPAPQRATDAEGALSAAVPDLFDPAPQGADSCSPTTDVALRTGNPSEPPRGRLGRGVGGVEILVEHGNQESAKWRTVGVVGPRQTTKGVDCVNMEVTQSSRKN